MSLLSKEGRIHASLGTKANIKSQLFLIIHFISNKKANDKVRDQPAIEHSTQCSSNLREIVKNINNILIIIIIILIIIINNLLYLII